MKTFSYDELRALVHVGEDAQAELDRRERETHEDEERDVPDPVTRLSFDEVMDALRQLSYAAGFSSWSQAFNALVTGELEDSVYRPQFEMYRDMLKSWGDLKKAAIEEGVVVKAARKSFDDLVEAVGELPTTGLAVAAEEGVEDAGELENPKRCHCWGRVGPGCYAPGEVRRLVGGHCVCCPARPWVGDGTLASYMKPVKGAPVMVPLTESMLKKSITEDARAFVAATQATRDQEKKISKRKKPMPIKFRLYEVWGPNILVEMTVGMGGLRDRTKRSEEWVRSLRVGRTTFANGLSVRRVK